MTQYFEPFAAVAQDFESRCIPIDRPGFYDHPAFTAMEGQDPRYLNNYARFVQRKVYDKAYLSRVRSEVPFIAELFRTELVKNGRLGACVDASMALSRILDSEGFWNYCVKGALTVTYPRGSGQSPSRFYSIDEGNFAAGHAWIVAPPFHVLDITIKQQPYNPACLPHLPDSILAEHGEPLRPQPEHVMSPIVIAHFRSRGVSRSKMLEASTPGLGRFLATFPPYMVKWQQTDLDYVTVAIGASDKPLKEIVNMRYEGRYAIEVYEQIIKPQLVARRRPLQA